MRLPLPFVLYVTSLGLFCWAGWTVYQSLDLWDEATRRQATNRGRDDAVAKIADGKSKGPKTGDWNYGVSNWWPKFKEVNLIGKLPERKLTPEEIESNKQPEEPVVDMTPLEDIFELVSLVYDGSKAGKGGESHIIIRYKADAGVEPPSWWVRENTPPSGNRMAAGVPRDYAAAPNTAVTKSARGRGGNRGGRGGNRGGRGGPNRGGQPTSAMPTTSIVGQQFIQKIWVDGGDDERRSPNLWGKYAHIRLVRVDPSAESAFFVRQLPAEEGQPAQEPKEEELLKTMAEIPQDVLIALRALQGRKGKVERRTASAPETNTWREVENTTRFGNEWHIGRKDQSNFRNTDELLNSVYVDTYVSKSSDLRGLSVRNVQPKIAAKYGVQAGDVLIAVNGRPVTSKGQAVSMVKKSYKRGVRTFATKWLSNGQEVERVYQAPSEKQ